MGPGNKPNILQLIAGAEPLGAMRRAYDSAGRTVLLRDMVGGALSVYAAALIARTGGTHVFVAEDRDAAAYLLNDFYALLDEKQVYFFPGSYKRSIVYGTEDAQGVVQRTAALSALRREMAAGEYRIICTYPEALAERVTDPDSMRRETVRVKVGDRLAIGELEELLADSGFTKVDFVYEPGQYSLRGGIFDVFSFSESKPYRLDFFGEEVDSIRRFEISSQLSADRLNEVEIVPNLNGFAGDRISLLAFAGEATYWFFDPDYVLRRVNDLRRKVLGEMEEPAEIDTHLVSRKVLLQDMAGMRLFELRDSLKERPADATVAFRMAPQPKFNKNFELLADDIISNGQRGYKTYILSENRAQLERLENIFYQSGRKEAQINPLPITLHEGFVDHDLKLCFYTDHQIFDRYQRYRINGEIRRDEQMTVAELNQLRPGDYVVHIDHGIGRFAGLVRIPNGNTTQEVIKLVYQNEDVVFVSIHSLHKISKYKGKEGEQPRISKLGTGAWEKIKERTKTKIKDIARDLIKLYSQRKQEKGFKYSPDSFLQHELEASFLYEDTPDQLKATQEVKADMESDKPMDRLVCGDVGFGKTEVAIRAAFKAVTDNKQVAVLVPTTVLAYQHFQTFKKRLEDMPCKVEYLSRARTAKDTSRILKELADGKINILIGTHKIIGKSVKFKDLGLLIIDEEQKFGVSVKEKLRQLKVNVDTLTLTATPIPRTLQFSLMGARDLSVIQTPPPNRYPIQTEVHTFNEEIISEAINFEMSRNGQVFFVNNRIQNLVELKAMILRNIPDCRVCIGHGQMQPEELEKIIFDFVNYDYDVLLATTIIESGIDIPNANTIIINQAQNFGLSDLHQMRGRVGRGNKKAFCYLLAPPLSSLTPEARRRLQAIENFSDLGSGIHIAMQDLDIRGAGNMLGAEQSGFIADLGYETYQKILNEAVTELKNEEFADLYAEEIKAGEEKISGEEFVDECTVESDLELLFPNEYIPSSSERMLLYRELDKLELDKDVETFKAKLVDRFGKIPPEGEELLRIVPLRRLAKRLGVEKVVLKAERMTLYFVSNLDSPYYQSVAFGKFIEYMAKNPRYCNLREQNGRRSMVVSKVTDVKSAVSILQEIVSIEAK